MKAFHSRSLGLLLIAAAVLISCGSGGGGMMAGGGIDGSGIISVGTISAFGSIVVNGTEFGTGNAVIIVGGKEIGIGDDTVIANLDVGKVITVEGTISQDGESIMADRVVYSNNVAGPVESVSDIDAATKEIVVLGQTVIVNVITKFKETSFDIIAQNDVVEVSGYFDDNDVVRATFLEKTGDITTILEYEVTGFVENLDTDLKTFMINGLKVNFSSIANNLPEGIPADGLYVEVEGTLDVDGETMIAGAIRLGDQLDSEDSAEFEIMGFVTEILSDIGIIKFKVGNQVVHLDPDIAVFVDGSPDDIVAGVKLEAEGSLEGGILFAAEIEFWGPDQIEVEGLITEVVSSTEFTVGDQVVQTDANTIFEPDGKTADDIAPEVMIEVKGSLAGSILVADKVSFE